MANRASTRFWRLYDGLPPEIQKLADKNFELFKRDRGHPSLHFKRVGRFWSARVGADFRALAIDSPDGLLWVWIGGHDEYDKLIRT